MNRRQLPTLPVLFLLFAACSGGAEGPDAPPVDDDASQNRGLDSTDPRVEPERVEVTQLRDSQTTSPEPLQEPDEQGDVEDETDAPADDLETPEPELDDVDDAEPVDDVPETPDVPEIPEVELTAHGETCTDDNACESSYCAPLFTGGVITTLGLCDVVPGAGEYWHPCEWEGGWCS